MSTRRLAREKGFEVHIEALSDQLFSLTIPALDKLIEVQVAHGEAREASPIRDNLAEVLMEVSVQMFSPRRPMRGAALFCAKQYRNPYLKFMILFFSRVN
ncbi:Uncharacterized protein APZ42_002050 [Daphnia magna]|uniref:Uncharacterized protein n=1 Tax=Daphnia magna TaxID=35525 RepID=A0A164IJP8_9CRUS|nr:Uncharacterized protein APZ42_002050 [Daphnia magna]